ncbi:MAG: dienelactone hydrolase family protein [Gemmatimonadaceae bacterium]
MRVAADAVTLDATLAVPEEAMGVVLFAHGSGSSRHSSRNRSVAGTLHEGGFATLLLDLLTPDEEVADASTGHLRFDIAMLAARLGAATDWVRSDPLLSTLPVGYFGASTGGGAALVAAAARPRDIRAVVSRGGRPDLAADALPLVRAPTLFIVGGEDREVLALNEAASRQMTCAVRIEIVPGATHLFMEHGAIEHVAREACGWFVRQLTARE